MVEPKLFVVAFRVGQALLHANEKHKFVMDLGEGEVIDASERGSILRFVNHSCGPNAETQKWTVQGKRRIGLFATETIEKGTEVCVCVCVCVCVFVVYLASSVSQRTADK